MTAKLDSNFNIYKINSEQRRTLKIKKTQH